MNIGFLLSMKQQIWPSEQVRLFSFEVTTHDTCPDRAPRLSPEAQARVAMKVIIDI